MNKKSILFFILIERFFLVILTLHNSKTTFDRQNTVDLESNLHREVRLLKEKNGKVHVIFEPLTKWESEISCLTDVLPQHY